MLIGEGCILSVTVASSRSPRIRLSGNLAGSYDNGVQSKDVVATVKNFVGNDQELFNQLFNQYQF